MTSEWRNYCRGADGVVVDDHELLVACGEGRSHCVTIAEQEDRFELTGVVARRPVVEAADGLAERAWQRNRSSQLVSFRIDRRGCLVGEAWVPKAGLEREEFLFYVRRLAAECDRFEWEVTGRDRE